MDHNKKSSLIKRIFYKLFGKARWIVLVLLVMLFLNIFLPMHKTTKRYASEYLDKNYDSPNEVALDSVVEFSINNEGTAVFFCDNSVTYSELCGILNVNNGTQTFANDSDLIDEVTGEEFNVYNIVVTDDNTFYAVTYDTLESTFITEESIIKISGDYRYLGEVCKISYDDNTSGSRVSRLHYYDGTVSFAVVEEDGVTLYSIDTATSGITISDKYLTDPDGTYTSSVIPVDGGFIFLRSDGSVYRTGFGEPLEECIYTFSLSPDGNSENPYFTQAVPLGNVLYLFDENEPDKVFALEDGEIREAFSVEEGSSIRFLDTYIDETGEEVLAVCLDNGLMTYKDGALTDENVIIKIGRHPLLILSYFVTIMLYLLIIAMIINLIIRKKTLLFKQIAFTIPILVFLIVMIAFNLYKYFIDQNNESIEREVSVIAELGSEEFEDYDFAPLLEVNGHTGEAYHDLTARLEGLSNNRMAWLRDDYYFTIIYHTSAGQDLVLGRSDRLSQPMYNTSVIDYVAESRESDEVYIVNDINSFWDRSKARSSSINAVKKINDKDGRGCYYLVVTTENKGFWNIRRDFIVSEMIYGSLLFVIMTFIVTISTIGITRSIKKARKTVERISEGDLTARVNYRSDDELGDICTKVNEMGQSLETLFSEKDKAEKFYYKFVPAKFKEYLGKENIADLTLGDASSRDLTVLFCDIRSFSINSEIMTAKENFAFVNTVYGKAGPVIRENNGFIDKYIGDAIMALFESADDAVKAGNELYKRIVLDPDTAKELNVSSINIGIGLHSGMAMVGIVGESERMSGTVISDTVNLSSRLESLTKQFKTAMLISKDTVDRMSDPEALNLRYLGMIQVAGVNEVKSVYEVLDCLPEEEKQKRSANAEVLKEAVRLFHMGQRDAACDLLKKLADSGKNDYVSDMYLKYISELSDEDKANVFRFVRK